MSYLRDFEWDGIDMPESRTGLQSRVSLCLGTLIEDGWFDLENDPTWNFPCYDSEQHHRLCKKIEGHYYYREISLTPPRIWKREFLRTMHEIMPKYIYLYGILDENPELLGAYSEYYKSRNIYSDFPATQLRGATSDYASSGNDMEFERIRQPDVMELASRVRDYDDIDYMIVKDIETLFTSLVTLNVNAL